MHFDIVEAIRQKQFKKQQSLSIENGDAVDIRISDGNVVVEIGPRKSSDSEDRIDAGEF